MILEERIAKLKREIVEKQKILERARSWPLVTAYFTRVIRDYPAKIALLEDKLMRIENPKGWLRKTLVDNPEWLPANSREWKLYFDLAIDEFDSIIAKANRKEQS